MPQRRSTAGCWCLTDTLCHFSLRIKVTETVLHWAVPLAETGLRLTSLTFTSSYVEGMSHLTTPEPPGEEDKESSPGEPVRTRRKVCQEGGRGSAHRNKQASKQHVPDTWLNSVPAWNRVALSLLLFRSVPQTLLRIACEVASCHRPKESQGTIKHVGRSQSEPVPWPLSFTFGGGAREAPQEAWLPRVPRRTTLQRRMNVLSCCPMAWFRDTCKMGQCRCYLCTRGRRRPWSSQKSSRLFSDSSS